MSVRLVVLAALCVVQTSACCRDSVGAIEFSLRFPGSAHQDSLAVGDTVTVWAGAITGIDWPTCVLYVSRASPHSTWLAQPDRFAFHSSDTTVAAFGVRGFLTALRPGETVLTATSAGVTSFPLVLTVR